MVTKRTATTATKTSSKRASEAPAKVLSAKRVRKVTAGVGKVIQSSPVVKVAKVTQAVVRARRDDRLSHAVRNKVVVVTGATSGIGEDCALKLAAAGATVILAARTPQKLHETLEKIEKLGGKAFAYACDISDMADCDRFCKVVLEDCPQYISHFPWEKTAFHLS